MKVQLKGITDNKLVENYLKRVGIVNVKKQMLHSLCHLIIDKGDIKLVHFKEVMQLQEDMYKNDFIKICINGFDGYQDGDVYLPKTYFRYVNGFENDFSFLGEKRGLPIDVFREFINQIFLEIKMDKFRGVQTNCYNQLETLITEFLDTEEDNGSNVFFKADLEEFIDGEYNSVAPMKFDDEMHKRRYLKILEDKELITCGEYDRDIPEFKVSFQDKRSMEMVEDTNSKFMDLNNEDELEFFFEPTEKISVELYSEEKTFGVLYDVTGKRYFPIRKHEYTEDIISFGNKKWLVVNMFEYLSRKVNVPKKHIIWSK